MEAVSWFSVSSVVFLAIGTAIGAAAGHFLSPAIGEARKLRSDLERLRHEHDSYRSSVNSHFRKTADLVGEMTKSYAAVYDHLAGGARRFCNDAGSDAAIPFEPLPGALASPVIETAAEGVAGDTAESLTEIVESSVGDGTADHAAGERPGYRAGEGDAEFTVGEPAAEETASVQNSDDRR